MGVILRLLAALHPQNVLALCGSLSRCEHEHFEIGKNLWMLKFEACYLYQLICSMFWLLLFDSVILTMKIVFDEVCYITLKLYAVLRVVTSIHYIHYVMLCYVMLCYVMLCYPIKWTDRITNDEVF